MFEMNPVLFSSLLATAALIAGFILYAIVAWILKDQSRKNSLFRFNNELLIIRPPLRFLLPALCLRLVMPWTAFSPEVLGALSHAISLSIIASVGWLAFKATYLVRNVLLSRYDMKAGDNLTARMVFTQIRVIENIVNVLITFLTLAVMLMTFESVRQIGVSLIASAGLAGVVLGFAAQKTLGNLIAGIQIAFAQPIRLDDVVIVEGEWGRIEEISLTYVVVKIWDLRRLVVPVSYFIEKPFQNWTRTSADILGTVFLYADYTIPVDRVRQELTRILEGSPLWDKKVNVLQVTNATEQTVELRALMSASDASVAWNLRCEVREKLLVFFQKELPNHLPKTRVTLQSMEKPPHEV